MAAEDHGRVRRDHVQSGAVRADRGDCCCGSPERSDAGAATARDPYLRQLRPPGREARRGWTGAPVGNQSAARHALLRLQHEGARRREHVDRARAVRGAGWPATVSRVVSRGCRHRARPHRQMGHRQHAVERRSVPELLRTARPAGARLEGVQEPRRERRCQRHAGDHHRDSPAPWRAGRAARVRHPRALADVGHHGEGARMPRCRS